MSPFRGMGVDGERRTDVRVAQNTHTLLPSGRLASRVHGQPGRGWIATADLRVVVLPASSSKRHARQDPVAPYQSVMQRRGHVPEESQKEQGREPTMEVAQYGERSCTDREN